jgi:hypothetical protein
VSEELLQGCPHLNQNGWHWKKVYEAVGFFGKFMPWSLSQFRELDTILGSLLRDMSHNLRSFPTELLYIPKDNLGMGFNRLSTLIQKRKSSLMHRMIGMGGRECDVMTSLVNRGLTGLDIHVPPGVQLHFPKVV